MVPKPIRFPVVECSNTSMEKNGVKLNFQIYAFFSDVHPKTAMLMMSAYFVLVVLAYRYVA